MKLMVYLFVDASISFQSLRHGHAFLKSRVIRWARTTMMENKAIDNIMILFIRSFIYNGSALFFPTPFQDKCFICDERTAF